ncbi:hypothetical protein HOK10_04090 [candidate division WWE3 bacterium]|nr:hypothetical protein [candidate division WWE3 bacterium]
METRLKQENAVNKASPRTKRSVTMLVSIKSLSHGPTVAAFNTVTRFTGVVTKIGLKFIIVNIGTGKTKKLVKLGKKRFNNSVNTPVFKEALVTFNVLKGRVIYTGYSSQQRLL